jgi:predicted regulator of Ras-like GTPase activity (Roadblock/LC7/MglB family)
VEVPKVWDEWGEDVQRVFLTFPEAVVEIPVDELGTALRQGRVMFTWGEIQKWIKPNLGSAGASVFEDTPLILPVQVLVPLFVQNLPAPKAQKRITVPDSIPNLFQTTAPAAAGALPKAEGSPSPAPADSGPAIATPPPQPASELGKVLGQPTKTDWTPKEVVTATTALAGVSGAVIATADGLLVSAQLPPEFKPEAVAAFVPQLFGRITQMSKELKLGDGGEVVVHIGQTIVYMAPSGRNVLVALGKRGLPFPIDSLNVIARELARK